MQQDTVKQNYSDKGSIIMEMIYAEHYLSPGGADTTKTLLELGDVADGLHVLDIGSGLGGAAFYLAAGKGCSVRGIDLMDSNVAEANRRATLNGLADKVRFVAADATDLPFDDETFSLVWGQDAWCHVEDKRSLLAEAHRVLEPGGSILFSDWLLRDQHSADADEIRRVTASPGIADAEMYLGLLDEFGFVLEAYLDTSDRVAASYVAVLERLRGFEQDLCTRFGQKVFEIVLSKQQMVADAFFSGLLGTGAFAARKA